MKKLIIALVAATAFTGSAMAADLASQPYTKAPAPVVVAPNWTGFYIFGGGGGGVWDGVGNDQARLSGVALTQDQHLGGDGWFGIVGAGFDWQFNRTWVAGVFADGQFGSMRGTLTDPLTAALSEVIGQETLKGTWAVGVRLGYLVAPNVLSYVNAGYTGTQWSGASYFSGAIPALVNGALFTTPSFTQNGWFVGGGVENSLDIFGIQIPGLFMKTEYRAAYFGRETLPETFTPAGVFAFGGGGGLTPDSPTLKPLVQTISTSLVYRFNWSGPVVAAFSESAMAADLATQPYTKAPAPVVVAPNWTGFYIFGGGGGGVWDGVGNVQAQPSGVALTQDQHLGGDGWFGTVGTGFDWQFNRTWVAGVFADGQFGSMRGTLTDPSFLIGASGKFIGQETLKDTWAVGVRLGYLVAPNVLSYVNAGYTGTQWSGASYFSGIPAVNGASFTTPSFTQNGWFVGGGVENSLDIFGIQIPGLFMKTEYRAAYFGRETLPETFTPAFGGGPTPDSLTFKPLVQTITTSLVYRFNWSGPVVAKY